MLTVSMSCRVAGVIYNNLEIRLTPGCRLPDIPIPSRIGFLACKTEEDIHQDSEDFAESSSSKEFKAYKGYWIRKISTVHPWLGTLE